MHVIAHLPNGMSIGNGMLATPVGRCHGYGRQATSFVPPTWVKSNQLRKRLGDDCLLPAGCDADIW